MSWWPDFKDKWNYTVVILLINHSVGIAGLNSANATFFEDLSWVNLLISFLLVGLSFHQKDTRFLLFIACAFFIGMVAEISGVTTGWPFGNYQYTSVLGFSLMGVPLIIGLNWALLALGCGAVAAHLQTHTWLRVVTASILMVLVDLLLEPFAIKHHFWMWATSTPPLSNYIAWLAVSLVVQLLFVRLINAPRSVVAGIYTGILLVFLLADKFLN